MNHIGELLKETRESSGVSVEEASNDLNIKEQFLLNIEEGKIGCFKDVFELKEYINNYAKYLGLDVDKIIDEFNDYLFEYTSKIPVEEIEKQAKIDAKENTNKVVSPYTRKPRKYNNGHYIAIYIIIVLLVILAIAWSIKQITVEQKTTTIISYINK